MASGQAQELVIRGGEDRVWVSCCGPHLLIAAEGDVDHGLDRMEEGDGRHASDGESRPVEDELGVGQGDVTELEQVCDLDGVDPVDT